MLHGAMGLAFSPFPVFGNSPAESADKFCQVELEL
jgi:hypothetical protein